MLCEICGKREAKFLINLEGATLYACSVCSKGAKIIGKIDKEKKKTQTTTEPRVTIEKTETIIDNFGTIIKNARKQRNLSIEELADMINEKISFLKHIEKETMYPTIKTARKLEKVLNIKLIEEIAIDVKDEGNVEKKEFSLGDFIERE